MGRTGRQRRVPESPSRRREPDPTKTAPHVISHRGSNTIVNTSALLVQCDFDDTITVGNVSTAIRAAFAPDEWRRHEEEYLAGKYSVEESNIRQFPLVKATRGEIEAFVLAEVVVRDGFGEFVAYCQRTGIRLAVVSSGLDMYIEPTMRREGLEHLEVHSGRAKFTGSGIQVTYADPCGTVIRQGFKESFVREFKRRGYTIIYIGDGLSDIAPATEADHVLARSTLERHFKASTLPYSNFRNFEDARQRVEEIHRPAQGWAARVRRDCH